MTPQEEVVEIRRRLNAMALLHATGQLDREVLVASHADIERSLLAIEKGLIVPGNLLAGALDQLPVLNLDDVIAEHKRRRPPARLRLVPTEGDAA